MGIGLSLIISCLAIILLVACSRPQFGRLPGDERLARIQASPNYTAEKAFTNTEPTEVVLNDQGMFSILWQDFSSSTGRQKPIEPLPAVKTDLKSLDKDLDVVIWLGHSSFFIQIDGQKILVDPVFSRYAAPFSFLNKAFDGTDLYTAEDMPEIDLLLISHDHWDHLDYPTVAALREKVGQVVTPLGVGEHFERWGYAPAKLNEGDWNHEFRFEKELRVIILPARHYSGRLFARNRTLWAGFAILTPQYSILLSGDSGYGSHFAELGRAFKGFDLAIMDGGQYDPRWPYIHMTPEEAVQAARDAGASSLIPGHIGKFDIASHPWDEPFIRFVRAARDKGMPLLTPKMGEPVWLGEKNPDFSPWWEEVN